MKASVIHDERLKQLADRITEDIFIRQNKEVEVATYQRSGLVEIPVQPLPNMRPLKCYFNVRDVIKEQGGTALFGWAFYNDDAGLFLFHDDSSSAFRWTTPRLDTAGLSIT